MNSERPTTVENSPSLRQGFFEQVEDLRLTHESEDYLMREAVAVFRKENQFQKYEELFLRAGELHEWIEGNLHLLTERNNAQLYSTYDEQLMSQIREKDSEFNAIKDELVKVLASLGYQEQEEIEQTSSAETSVSEVSEEIVTVVAESEITAPQEILETTSVTETLEKNPSKIERLTEKYKNADKEAFKVKRGEGWFESKPFRTIQGEIRSVLEAAGFNKDRVKIFMNEAVSRVGYEVKELSIKQSATIDLKERELLKSQIDRKYQELLEAVAGFLQTEKVDEAEGEVDGELPTEGLDNVDAALEIALEEFETLKQSGTYKEENPIFKEAALVVERLQSYTETDAVRASHDKERYLRKLQAALVALKALTQEVTPDVAFEEGNAAEVDSVEPLVAGEVVKDAVQQPLPDAATVAPEGVPEEKYENKYENHFEAKKNFKVKDREYKESLKAYYEDKNKDATWRARFRNGLEDAQKVFGINPELPPALQAMKNESRRLRSLYVGSLASALKERGEREGNKEFYIGNDKTKVAFGRKFILEPNQEMIKLQEAALPPETVGRVHKVLQTMSKYKWHTRVGTVAVAGALGLASGGVGALVAGASYQAWKMAASTGMGAGAGLLARKVTQARIDKAKDGLDSAEARVGEKFSVANLDELEAKLEQAQFVVDVRERQQKPAIIAAAVAAGGLTGYGLSQFDGESNVSASNEGLSQESVGRIVAEEIAAEAAVEPAPTKPPVAEAAPSVAEPKPEMITETVPEFKIKPFTMPFYGFSGNLQYETVFSGIKIDGAFTAGELPEATRLELEKHIKLSMDDSLHAHPNIAEEKLEAEVLAKVQAKFGSAPWYASAGITKIDIEGMSVRPYTIGGVDIPAEVSEKIITGGKEVSAAIGSTESTYTEASPVRSEAVVSQEKISGSYVVQKGDILSEITEKRFSGLLKDIPPIQRGQILDELFRNIQADADLRNSLGIRSENVDLIYSGEKVNLDGVEAELTRLVEREQILENFRTSGPLSVEADAEVKNVPITVVEKVVPAPVSVEVTADSGRVYKEAVPVPVERPVAPRPFALNGQYAEQPTYKEYINKTFGSMKVFEQAVEKSVQSFDNNTYDIFERPGFFGGSNYESPYRFLGEMTLQEVTEFETQPNEQIRAFMQENNMKYDTYLAWLDQIDLMVRTLPNEAETTVADLFARYVAENQAPKVNPLIKTP